MSTRNLLRQLLSERRSYSAGSPDWTWRTRAARKFVWMLRGVPTAEWSE